MESLKGLPFIKCLFSVKQLRNVYTLGFLIATTSYLKWILGFSFKG